MPLWRDDKILELANQLTYSPADKRREQLSAAMGLLPAVEAGKDYPWDFVHFRITSFQPRTHIDHVVAGKILRADLASLIEFLSDTLSIRVEEAAAWGLGDGPSDRVLEFEDVTRKFNVSSKTIQRWRKQGLVALRYLYADGRRRLGFMESAVARFAAENKEKVDKSAAFKQLTDEERAKIIVLARELVRGAGGAHGISGAKYCIKDVSRLIGKHLGRAPETVRYTIRRYDAEHPEAAIFGDGDEAQVRRVQRAALEVEAKESGDAGREMGGSAEGSGAEVGTSASASADGDAGLEAARGALEAAARAELQERAQELKLRAVEFMANPLFEHPDADSIILQVLPAEAVAKALASVSAGVNVKAGDVYMARVPGGLPAFLEEIFRQPVMPAEMEVDAFRRMNYLKWKATQLQAGLGTRHDGRVADGRALEAQIAEIEGLLARAAELKNAILQGNLRVAVHVARKHQRFDRPLMELVSDATMWVMRAIETFDFTRHTRFSTYAGYAVMKNFARDRAERLTRRDTTMLTGQEEILESVGDRSGGENDAAAEQMDVAALSSELRQEIENLPERERELLASHYGLEQGKPPLSLSEIGDRMGITKARVRQLEARALRQLRVLMEARREKIRAAAAKLK